MLQKTRKQKINKRACVKRENEGGYTYPESTSTKSDQTALKPRFLTLLSHPLIHTLPQPNIRLHIPRIKQHLEIRCELDVEHVDVGCFFPC